MKKIILLLTIVTLFSSCNVSKITTDNVVNKAILGKKVDATKYVNDKMEICNWLNFSDSQKIEIKKLFIEEITKLKDIEDFDRKEIAKHIYKYESQFRSTLNSEQIKVYKKLRPKFDQYYFYSDWQLNRIESSTLSIN